MDFNNLENILEAANIGKILYRTEAEEEARNKTINSGNKKDIYRHDKISDVENKRAEEALLYDRREQRKENKEAVEKAAADQADTSEFKKMVEKFLHTNVSKTMNAKDQDVITFKRSLEGQSIPTQYLPRWKYIMNQSLANKTYRQSIEEKSLTRRSNEALGKSSYTGSYGAQGDFVIVDSRVYEELCRTMPEKYVFKKKGLNAIVSKKDCKAHNLPFLTKSSDFWLEDENNSKVFVTFKSVENQGGAQKNQINDVQATLRALRSNFKANDAGGKSIAVIRGAEINKYVKKNPDATVVFDNRVFKPIRFRGNNGKEIKVPRILSEGEWLYFLKMLNLLFVK